MQHGERANDVAPKFSILKKCNGKFDCRIFFVQQKNLKLKSIVLHESNLLNKNGGAGEGLLGVFQIKYANSQKTIF